MKQKDKNTWTRAFEYTKDMQDRGELMIQMASSLCEWNSIVDIGCGNQQLKQIVEKIKPDAKYIGIDRLDHCNDTLLADFNKGEYPVITADLAVVSGVFEYIKARMVNKFINNVCASAPIVAFSYCSTDYVKRRNSIWVNHYKLSDIIKFFNVRDFHIEMLKMYKNPQQFVMIFKANG